MALYEHILYFSNVAANIAAIRQLLSFFFFFRHFMTNFSQLTTLNNMNFNCGCGYVLAPIANLLARLCHTQETLTQKYKVKFKYSFKQDIGYFY